MNEIRRMQARIDWFMKAHANRNTRQEQPRVRTRERRPVCDICGRVGHVRQNCYARVDQRNQYHNPQTNQPHPQSGPRIAALEAKDTSEPSVAQFNHQYPPRVNALFASNAQDDKIHRGYDSGSTRKLDKATMTFPPSNQLTH